MINHVQTSVKSLASMLCTAAIVLSLGAAAALAQPTSLTRADVQAIAQICRPDIQTFCRGVPQGGGLIAKCLRQNVEALSAPCRAKIEPLLQ